MGECESNGKDKIIHHTIWYFKSNSNQWISFCYFLNLNMHWNHNCGMNAVICGKCVSILYCSFWIVIVESERNKKKKKKLMAPSQENALNVLLVIYSNILVFSSEFSVLVRKYNRFKCILGPWLYTNFYFNMNLLCWAIAIFFGQFINESIDIMICYWIYSIMNLSIQNWLIYQNN